MGNAKIMVVPIKSDDKVLNWWADVPQKNQTDCWGHSSLAAVPMASVAQHVPKLQILSINHHLLCIRVWRGAWWTAAPRQVVISTPASFSTQREELAWIQTTHFSAVARLLKEEFAPKTYNSKAELQKKVADGSTSPEKWRFCSCRTGMCTISELKVHISNYRLVSIDKF